MSPSKPQKPKPDSRAPRSSRAPAAPKAGRPRKAKPASKPNEQVFPTLVSFFGGAEYYYQCAENLKNKCEELGVKYHLEEVEVPPDQDWAMICRRKVPFFLDMWKRYPGGVLWVDVDTELLRAPDFVGHGGGVDFGAMLRGHKYLKGFDPFRMTRMFAPTYLYFGPTKAAGEFLEHMARLEAEQVDIVATDDYFLQEAWLTFKGQLNIQLFPPRIESIDGKNMHRDPYFGYGRSGQVKEFVGTVAQHEPETLNKKRVEDVLKALIKTAESNGIPGRVEHLRATLLEISVESSPAKPQAGDQSRIPAGVDASPKGRAGYAERFDGVLSMVRQRMGRFGKRT